MQNKAFYFGTAEWAQAAADRLLRHPDAADHRSRSRRSLPIVMISNCFTYDEPFGGSEETRQRQATPWRRLLNLNGRSVTIRQQLHQRVERHQSQRPSTTAYRARPTPFYRYVSKVNSTRRSAATRNRQGRETEPPHQLYPRDAITGETPLGNPPFPAGPRVQLAPGRPSCRGTERLGAGMRFHSGHHGAQRCVHGP